ncbi:MAG: electron transport complex subunit E [Gammaproteobacteria bacterium]|nr:MAG: electron transport complex subunit E [Gammaproteobacteria bacterium]
MAEPAPAHILRDGLWSNNPALVQILGLCPLLAVTATVVNGLALGLATLATLVLSNTVVSLVRHHVTPEIRVAVYVLIIACIVTAIELAMDAYFHDLYLILGIFIPLIVTNCNILARAEAFASRHPVLPSALDGLAMGLGFTAVLVALGALRELLGRGTLFSQAELLLGEAGRLLQVQVLPEDYRGWLLAALPPGAFIGLGLLIALKNVIDARRRPEPAAAPAPAPAAGQPAHGA